MQDIIHEVRLDSEIFMADPATEATSTLMRFILKRCLSVKKKKKNICILSSTISEIISVYTNTPKKNHMTILAHWVCMCSCEQEADFYSALVA